MAHRFTRFLRGARTAMALALAVSLLGCGDDGAGPTGSIKVELSYPSQRMQDLIASVHVWALGSRDGTEITCPALVGQEAGPYDFAYRQHADQVFILEDVAEIVTDPVPYGPGLVYVEAVDLVGLIQLAGCARVDVEGDPVLVSVNLTAPGTFDCSDPATPNDAPCDDNLFCTIGEKCRGGACSGGTTRECAAFADDCNAGRCDEDQGCHSVPLPNGTSCDDGLYCTTSDVCQEGVCGGLERDCSDLDDACNVGVCDETYGGCTTETVPNNTPCDLYCTVGGICSYGWCSGGSARDCSGVVTDDCHVGRCDEDLRQCVADPLTGTYCDDGNPCTINEQCQNGTCTGGTYTTALCDDGDPCTTGERCQAGACTGGAVTDVDGDGYSPTGCPAASLGTNDCDDLHAAAHPGMTEDTATGTTCSDGLDNDCDTFVDDLDTGCQ